MAEYETILTAVEGGIGKITINRPDSHNSLNMQVLGDLRSALAEFTHDDRVGVIVFTGAGEKAFAAGADIRELKERTMFDALISVTQAVYDEVEAYEKPTIAAVNGYALGGGCELAMACDIRIAAEGAKFGQPEVKLGLIPGYGGTQRLPRLVGKGRALQLLLTGEIVDAQEAHRIGLVSDLYPPDQLMDEAHKLAQTICENAPLSVRAAKMAVVQGGDLPLPAGLALENQLWGALRDTEDRLEGRAAFAEKRKPQWKGR